MLRICRPLATATLVMASFTAQATLQPRAGGMVYDSAQNLTWLSDWNYSLSSGYAAGNVGGTGSNSVEGTGRMGFDAAVTWASNLVFGGYDDWRLPSTNPTASSNCDESFNPGDGVPVQYFGFLCTGSEMGRMFYTEFGAAVASSVFSGTKPENLGRFSNIQSSPYWTGTANAARAGSAWYFDMGFGSQYGFDTRAATMFAVAVRSGDVIAAVPEPQTYAMLGLGLTALTIVARRRTSKAFKPSVA